MIGVTTFLAALLAAPAGAAAQEPATCDPCSADADCGAGGLCLMYPDGGFHCGAGCATDADCGLDSCEAINTGALQCVRRDEAGDADCTFAREEPEPEPEPAPEPAPAPPTDPPADDGTAPPDVECVDDTDCAAGTCIEGACVEPPGEPDVDVDLGAACLTHAQCAGRYCIVLGDATPMCSRGCGADRACPGGWSCVGLVEGIDDVCVPDDPAFTDAGSAMSSSCAITRAPGGAAPAVLLGLALLALLVRRSRRSAAA